MFELQDRITEEVVSAIEPQIRKAEIERARRKRPELLDAHDLFLRALPHVYAVRPPDCDVALELLEEAMRLDPGYVPAAAFAAWCHEQRIIRNWPGVSERDSVEALRLARITLAADTDDALMISIAGFVLVMVGHDHDAGLAALARAVELNAHNPLVLSLHGWANVLAGNLDVARASLERARHLSRRDPIAFAYQILTGLAMNHLLAGRCEEAAQLAAASASVYSDWDTTYLVQGMALACLGRTDEATAAMANLARVLPGATVSLYGRTLPIRDPARRALLHRYLRAAGLPE